MRFSMTRKNVASLVTAAVVVLTTSGGCEGDSQVTDSPDSDSSHTYSNSSEIPVDETVYNLQVVVLGAPSSIVRQSEAGSGAIYGANGYLYGTVNGPKESGKGLVRVRVLSIEPKLDYVSTEQAVILKTTDTKATALFPGDRVNFRCENQLEAMAATYEDQEIDTDTMATWELDYCRLATSVISPGE